jgi:hypothetical protein
MTTQRKKYIIDKKFQFKTTFSIIGVVTILSAIILGSISYNIFYNNEKIKNIYDIESSIMDFFSSQTYSGADESYKSAFKTQMANHKNNMKSLINIITYNRIMLIILFIILLIQGVILYILLIKKTHRISGPIYIMSKYMNEIIEGKTPVTRPLREKDELKDFYGLFNKMLESIKKQR